MTENTCICTVTTCWYTWMISMPEAQNTVSLFVSLPPSDGAWRRCSSHNAAYPPARGWDAGGGTSVCQCQTVPPHPEAQTGPSQTGGWGQDPQGKEGKRLYPSSHTTQTDTLKFSLSLPANCKHACFKPLFLSWPATWLFSVSLQFHIQLILCIILCCEGSCLLCYIGVYKYHETSTKMHFVFLGLVSDLSAGHELYDTINFSLAEILTRVTPPSRYAA